MLFKASNGFKYDTFTVVNNPFINKAVCSVQIITFMVTQKEFYIHLNELFASISC